MIALLQSIVALTTLPGQQRRLHADSAAIDATKAIVTQRAREKRNAAGVKGWVTRRGVDRG